MGYNKGGGSQRGRPYVLILLMTFGAALLGVMVLHRFREKRIYNLLVNQKDHQLLTLQVLLQKERDRAKELSRKNEETRAKIYTLSNQKMELTRTIAEMQSTMSSLKDEQKLIESAYAEKQYELRMMQQRGSNLGQGGTKRISSRENLKKTEADIEDLKSIDDHPAIFDQILAANATKEAQSKTKNDNQEKDQNSKYGGDESKSKLTEFKDGEVTAEIKEEIKTNEELGKKNDNPADDGASGKEAEAKVVEDKKAIIEEHQRKLEVNTDGGRQDFKAKQLSGAKREHGHLSRTEGARWRNIVKNKLMESNGIFENHGEVNMVKTKVYKEDKDGTDKREAESQANLLKPENNEDKDGNNTTVDKTNHQETDNGINNHPEEHEDGAVQQNWSRRRINNASNNAEQTKSNMFHEEEPEELEVSDVQKQEKDAIDGEDDGEEDNNDEFFNESQPEFEDENEKEEYKEEIDESEFQHGL
uniref:Transmembrane protein n=1 Tax=Medicago truncatula TaxID=3880 RepID=I3SHY5_MEDTR|nr:unknown [Medicago truncatula]